MRVVILLIAILFVLSFGETAKEAHDRSVECAKKCARHPSVLRCEMQCKNPPDAHGPKEAHKARSVGRKIRPNKVEAKKVHPTTHNKSNRKMTTIKGRRVYLVRKN